MSAWGNWQAAPEDLTAKLLHAAAPVILALVLEELLRVMRHKVHLHTVASANPEALPLVAPVTTETGNPQVQVEGEVDPECEGRVEVDPSPVALVGPPVPAQVAPTPAAARPEVVPGAAQTPPLQTQPMRVLPVTATSDESLFPVEQRPVTGSETSAAQPRVEVAYDEETLPSYPEDGTFKEQVKAILLADPTTSAAKIARVMAKDKSYTRKMVREARTELDAEAEQAAAIPVRVPVQPSPSAPARTGVVSLSDDLDDADPFAMSAPAYAAR